MPLACSLGDDGALRGGARCRAGGRAERITDEHSRTNRSLAMNGREVRGEIQSPLSPHANQQPRPKGRGMKSELLSIVRGKPRGIRPEEIKKR